jgi:hypothetical protein
MRIAGIDAAPGFTDQYGNASGYSVYYYGVFMESKARD